MTNETPTTTMQGNAPTPATTADANLNHTGARAQDAAFAPRTGSADDYRSSSEDEDADILDASLLDDADDDSGEESSADDDETSEADIEAALSAYDPDEEDDEEEDAQDDTDAPAAPIGDLDTEEKVRLMAEAADAVRAEDIQVLDLRPLTIIADYFLICTGKSSIQLRAIADRIEEKMRDNGVRKPRMQGYQEGTWILLDYGDVVAHLMAAEQRAFYSLEDFWEAAPRLTLQLLPDESRATRPTPASFETLTPVEDDEDDEDDEDYDEDDDAEDDDADDSENIEDTEAEHAETEDAPVVR